MFCLILSSVAFAQVFPQEEYLDVVNLVDGSVLRGRIVGHHQNQSIRIEIYGGSTFEIASANILSIEQEANPDFGTDWVRVAINAAPARRLSLSPAGELRPFVANGQFLALGTSWGSLTGIPEEYDSVLQRWRTRGGNCYGSTLSYAALRDGVRTDRRDVRTFYGIQGSIEYRLIDGNPLALDDLNFLAELLMGLGGKRYAGYMAFGPGVTGRRWWDSTSYPADRWENSAGSFWRVSFGNLVQLTSRYAAGLRVYGDLGYRLGRVDDDMLNEPIWGAELSIWRRFE
jgi:hypothetical protein